METRILDLLENEIDIRIDDIQIGRIKIPSGYVNRTFAPRIEEHIVFDGTGLQNGQIVLLADSADRADPDDIAPGKNPSPWERMRVQETARWALVTDVKVDRSHGNELLKFTAIYADGTMIPIMRNVSFKWAIMKDVEVQPVCPNCGEIHSEAPIIDPNKIVNSLMDAVFGVPKENPFGPLNVFFNTIYGRRAGGTDIVSDEDQYGAAPSEPDFGEFLEKIGLRRTTDGNIEVGDIPADDTLPEYSEADVETTQKLGEEFQQIQAEEDVQIIKENVAILEAATRRIEDGDSMEEVLKELTRKPGKLTWVNDIPVTLVEEGDWIPFAGELYRVLIVDDEGGTSVGLYVKPLRKELPQKLTIFSVNADTRVDVKRRIKR